MSKVYTGIVLEDDSLKIARIKVSGKKISLLNVDKIRLVEPLRRKETKAQLETAGDVFGDFDDNLGDEGIFGVESDDSSEDIGLDDLSDGLDDLGLDNLDDLDEGNDFDSAESGDMISESGEASSNDLLFYNVLSSIDPKKINLGLTIPAGDTIFQILKDVDFSETKKKDLKVIVSDRLEALYGGPKGEDYYSYSVRDDGALLLASVDDEAPLLELVNKTKELYTGKIFIEDIMPDETVLLGLLKSNYELEETSITGVVQFGEVKSRIFFMRGKQLWIVSPIINEGVKSSKILNTIFSKILFQLDTGEVPSLDNLIICNNTLGEEAIEFFADRFQDINVSEFKFSDDYFEADGISESSVAAFTTAIGAAWNASGFQKENFPKISFLPKYITDRQKVFKLHWHGMLLLLLILLTPIVANYFYTKNAAEIDRLTNDVNSLNTQIQALEPTVQEYNRISAELDQIQSKLELLSTLNQETLQWSTNLHYLNSGVEDINSLWVNSMKASNNGQIEIQGYAIYRNRVPQLANLFDNATLLSVSTQEIREKEVYVYRYMVKDFFKDKSIYTPKSVQGIKEIIGD